MAALPAKGCPLAYLAAFLQAVRKDFPWKDLAALKVPEHWFFSIFIFCSKSTRATWNSCSLCANWGFTSMQAPLGSCTKARGGSSLCKGQLAWGFLSEEATKDLLSLQHLSCVHLSRQGESHLHAALEHKALHTNALGHFWQAISSWSSPPTHLPLATAPCVTEKYGIFIPYLRPSLCSFAVPWKPNFYSCQQITFRLTGECVVAWILFYFIFKCFFFFLRSKKRIEDLFLKIISPPSTHCAATTEHFGSHENISKAVTICRVHLKLHCIMGRAVSITQQNAVGAGIFCSIWTKKRCVWPLLISK